MKRNLLTQIKNEWRDNLWLIIELTVVSVAVWTLAMTLITALRPKLDEKGYSIEDVYKIKIRLLDETSPEFADMGEKTEENNTNDIRTLLNNIRKSEYVEAAAISYNALPYQFNYVGNMLEILNSQDSIQYYGNLRMASPEIVRILRPISRSGLSLSELEKIMKRGEILISPEPRYDRYRDVNKLIGKRTLLFDTINSRRIGGVIESLKRNEYEPKIGTILVPIDESDNSILNKSREIAIKVKQGMGKKFEEEFNENADMRKLRNIYFTELSDMNKVRSSNQYHSNTQVRLWSAGIVFLLVIIFLGLFGTFWFRIRQRSGEIALRKTCGATSRDIFQRTIGEGMLLITIAIIPAMILIVCIDHYILNPDSPFADMEWTLIAWSFIFTFILMSLMIIAGIVFPARTAMKIEPAIALKEE